MKRRWENLSIREYSKQYSSLPLLANAIPYIIALLVRTRTIVNSRIQRFMNWISGAVRLKKDERGTRYSFGSTKLQSSENAYCHIIRRQSSIPRLNRDLALESQKRRSKIALPHSVDGSKARFDCKPQRRCRRPSFVLCLHSWINLDFE